ncbi:MAG: NUDIX hydrolase [Cyclobacteriaceae bacterium]|nr:NUDIX hydrolase [Flammeovirgaceae bacterium]
MTRIELIHQLNSYQTSFTEEQVFIERFLELLDHPDAYQRTHLPGHITGSAWIINEAADEALLVHHAKLDKWVQPGGHADGDENILAVALREAQEETGILHFEIQPIVFDMDIHTIPARKDFPEHQHYDIRFLMKPLPNQSIAVSEESLDVKWIPLTELENFTKERSVLRMKDKIERLAKPALTSSFVAWPK